MGTQTHDLTKRMWGQDYAINEVIKNGARLRLVIWSSKQIVVGDYLIIRNGGNTTRYQVDEVKYCADPPDMLFAKVSFAPRPDPAMAVA